MDNKTLTFLVFLGFLSLLRNFLGFAPIGLCFTFGIQTHIKWPFTFSSNSDNWCIAFIASFVQTLISSIVGERKTCLTRGIPFLFLPATLAFSLWLTANWTFTFTSLSSKTTNLASRITSTTYKLLF